MNLKCRRCRADWGQHMLVNENMEHLCYNRDIEEKNVCMQNMLPSALSYHIFCPT